MRTFLFFVIIIFISLINEGKQEFEPNVGIKLIQKLKKTYENGIDVILQMIMMSYNLWELYIYWHLHDFEKKKITKIGFI